MSGHEIIDAETRWARAAQSHHLDRLTGLMHPNFIFIGLRDKAVQSWSRTEWITAVRKVDFRLLEYKVRDLQVFGQTAVATIDGRWSTKGEAIEERVVMTDVWTKAPNGPWRVVRRHSTTCVEESGSRPPLDVPELVLDI